MRRLIAAVFSILTLAGQKADTKKESFVSARLEANVESSGTLRAVFNLTADGPSSIDYRNAYVSPYPSPPSPALFGPYLRRRHVASPPLVVGAGEPLRPVAIGYTVLEDDFLLPIAHGAALQFDLLPPAPENMQPGVRREEIVFEIPKDFSLEISLHVHEDHQFARYGSDATVESGKLVIRRELEVKEASDSSERGPAEGFWQMVHTDQERTFLLRRKARADIADWVASVPPSKASSMGRRAQEQHEYEAARRLFEKATGASPNDNNAWNGLGLALAALGRLEDAERAYEKQIAVNATGQAAYNNLALVYERQGKWAKAIDAFEKELQFRPGDPYVTGNLPRALIHEKRWQEAEAAAVKALQLQPTNAGRKLNVAVAHICSGKSQDPRLEIDEAIGQPSASLLNNAAYYLTECGRNYDLAESYVRGALDQAMRSSASAERISSAVSAQNSLSTYLDTYGWLLLKEDKPDQAIPLMSASIALAPRADVFMHLAQAESKAGHVDQATIFWRQAAFLEPGLLPQVPEDIAAKFGATQPLSIDGEWYPLQADLPASVLDLFRYALPDQPSYYYVVASASGAVETIRALNDSASIPASEALRSIRFPVIQIDDKRVSSVHFLRVVKDENGKVQAARSVGAEAIAIVTDLLPGEFPVSPPAPTPPASSAASPAGAYRIGGGVSAPSVLSKVEPIYSEEARKAALAGTVRLTLVVGPDGEPRDMRVVQSLGLGLDEQAIAAVDKWRFRPGMRQGQPVPVIATIEMNFRLLEKSNAQWHMTRVEFRTPDGAARPFVDKVTKPHVASDAGLATATVAFDIDDHGTAVNVHIEKASDQEWADELMRVLRSWRFAPASKDGVPVAAACSMDFTRGG